MVRRFLSLFGRDIESIHQAAYILAGATFLGQVLGLFRDRLLASTFGAGSLLDVYYAAFRLQDIIFVTIGSMLSAVVLIPLFSITLEKEGKEKLHRIVNSIFTVAFYILLLISSIAVIFARKIALMIFPGVPAEYEQTLVDLMRLLLLSPFLFSLSGVLGALVQVYNRFAIVSIAPLLYNLGIILGIVFLYPMLGLTGIGLGVLLGALMHAGIHAPFIIRQGLFPHFTRTIEWVSVKETVYLALQRGLALGTQHLGLIFLTGLATTIAVGSVSVMTLATNLQGMFLSLIGLSYAVAAFPTLARMFVNGNHDEFAEKLCASMRHVIFWSLPTIALIIVLRAYIVRAVLGAGIFDWTATTLTAACLAIFSIAILLQGLMMLIFRAFYASNRNKDVMIITVIGEFILILSAVYLLKYFESSESFRYFLESLFRVENSVGSAVLIIPIAFVIGYFVKLVLSLFLLKRVLKISIRNLVPTFIHSFAASCAVGIVTYEFADYFATLFGIETFFGVFFTGFFAGIMGTLSGAVLLYMLRNNEFHEIIKAIRRKFSPDVIVGVQEGQ